MLNQHRFYATRPLAIRKDGTWYTYGWNLSKNICEVYGQHGYIRTNYSYSPYGEVTISGDVTQPIQWSSEYNDTELALVYYNYRHYNPQDGRWIGKDKLAERNDLNLYLYSKNSPIKFWDILGLLYYKYATCFYRGQCKSGAYEWECHCDYPFRHDTHGFNEWTQYTATETPPYQDSPICVCDPDKDLECRRRKKQADAINVDYSFYVINAALLLLLLAAVASPVDGPAGEAAIGSLLLSRLAPI